MAAIESQPILPSSSTEAGIDSNEHEILQPHGVMHSEARNPRKWVVTCSFCQLKISVRNIESDYIAFCWRCKERTVIRDPPVGMTFVRCPCKNLILARESSKRILCTRPNCKNILKLTPNESTAEPTSDNNSRNTSGKEVIICTYCGDRFLFSTVGNSLVRCPCCGKFSGIGSAYQHTNMGFIFFAIGIFTTVLATFILVENLDTWWLIVVSMVKFSLGVIFFARSYYCFRIPISMIEMVQV